MNEFVVHFWINARPLSSNPGIEPTMPANLCHATGLCNAHSLPNGTSHRSNSDCRTSDANSASSCSTSGASSSSIRSTSGTSSSSIRSTSGASSSSIRSTSGASSSSIRSTSDARSWSKDSATCASDSERLVVKVSVLPLDSWCLNHYCGECLTVRNLCRLQIRSLSRWCRTPLNSWGSRGIVWRYSAIQLRMGLERNNFCFSEGAWYFTLSSSPCHI